jgi:hypothetical protein
MALTLDAGVAAETANSYVTAAYADEYWQQHFSQVKAAQWAALTTARKESALIQACRIVESLRYTYDNKRGGVEKDYYKSRSTGRLIEYPYKERPVKYYTYQALQFPRSIDLDSQTAAPYVPEAVQMAQCEQAMYMLTFDEAALSSSLQGVASESITAGPVSISQTFKSSSSGGGSLVSPTAFGFLKPFLIHIGRQLRRA